MPLSTTMDPSSDTEDNWIAVVHGPPDTLAGYTLVLDAMGIAWQEKDHSLLVPETEAELARHHIRAYREENRDWPPPPAWTNSQTEQIPTPPTLFMMGLLALFYQLTGPWETASRWFSAGAIDSVAILRHGQWWRLFTAMTLHANANHLLGNVLIGGFLVHLLCRTIGYGTAWLLVLLTGGLANYVNIVLRAQEHHAVGFSTAVFAAIGIFSGMRLPDGKRSSIQILIALGAGAGLLAFLGSEGRQTDLGAHLFGFACGIPVGLFTRLSGLAEKGVRRSLQRILLILALLLVITCWRLALHGGRLW